MISLALQSDPVRSRKIVTILCLLLVLGVGFASLPCEGAKRRFTVADDIELSHFGDPYTAQAESVIFSPDGRYFAVTTERGRLDLNRPESSIRIYRIEDVHQFLVDSKLTRQPLPLWVLNKSTYKDGPIITHIRWLADSSGLAFLQKTATGSDQLVFADVKSKRDVALTGEGQQVTAFDVRDRSHYVYCVQSPLVREKAISDGRATSIVGNGRNIYNLLFAVDDLHATARLGYDLSELWAVVDGRRFQVKDTSGEFIPVRSDGQQALALSPDGHSVVMALAVRSIPREWEALYVPPWPSDPYHIRSGKQNPGVIDGHAVVSEYVRINLANGETKSLVGAPIGDAAGWWASLKADWASDGKSVVLSNTFVPAAQQGSTPPTNRPCVAVVDFDKGTVTCLERLTGQNESGAYEDGFRFILSARFLSGANGRITIHYYVPDGSDQSQAYSRTSDGSWSADSGHSEVDFANHPIGISVRQDLNTPPVLVGTDHQTKLSAVIWDPNPQLKDIELATVSIFRWRDNTGRDWVGGLYKPPDYVQGRRYPLVIQTHGFHENTFDASGIFPTAFAAQELASAGIIVLQVRDCPIRLTPEEASCQVAGYEAAVKELTAQSLIDANRIGIVGFSRTCYYVMEALTNSGLHFKAASINNGAVAGYLEYIMSADASDNAWPREVEAMMGAPPFGEGLTKWLKRSPEFNLNKVTTPLQVVAGGREALLTMWEPYAVLRYLNKPVDLIVFTQRGTHVLSNPSQRLVSQGGTVDWFRFWLCNEADPDPHKNEQYIRWNELRNLQDERASFQSNNRGTRPPEY
jgi:dipeptidyl aminopeptidase/acylaminoacyl peptidase